MKEQFTTLMLEAILSTNQETWSRYAFRPEYRHDGLIFIGAISSFVKEVDFNDTWLQIETNGYKEDHLNPFPDCVSFSLSPELNIQELRWIANELADLHVIFETLEPEETFSGERNFDAHETFGYCAVPAPRVVNQVLINLNRLQALEPLIQSTISDLIEHFSTLQYDKRFLNLANKYLHSNDFIRQYVIDHEFSEYHSSRFGQIEAWPTYSCVAESSIEIEFFAKSLGYECKIISTEAIQDNFQNIQFDELGTTTPRFKAKLRISQRIPFSTLKTIAEKINNGALIASTLKLDVPGATPESPNQYLSHHLNRAKVRLAAYQKYLQQLENLASNAVDSLDDALHEINRE